MNSTPTELRPPAAAQPVSFPRRVARLLLTGPAMLTSPMARWAVNPAGPALWLSQLIVFAVYPVAARQHHARSPPGC